MTGDQRQRVKYLAFSSVNTSLLKRNKKQGYADSIEVIAQAVAQRMTQTVIRGLQVGGWGGRDQLSLL
jgi:hypothetical protein